MKKVINSYLKFLFIIVIVITVSLIFIDQLNVSFICENYTTITATLFYSFGTLGFLVDISTWNGDSEPEKLSRIILILCYILGAFFTIIGLK